MEEPIPFPVNAAKLSWMAPIGASILGVFCRLMLNRAADQGTPLDPLAPWIFNGAAVLLMVAGLVAGVMALLSVKKHGPERILIPATIGVAFNIVLVVITVSALMHLRNLAPKRTSFSTSALSQLMDERAKSVVFAAESM